MNLNTEELIMLIKLIEFRLLNSEHIHSTEVQELSVLASKLKSEVRGNQFI